MRLRFAVSFEPTAGPKGRPTRHVFTELLCDLGELCGEILRDVRYLCDQELEMKIASATVLTIALSVSAHAQTAQPLTALDYFEIQQLASKYARAIDTCSNNGYDYADLFAADGYFQPEQGGKLGAKFQGRERLAEASGGGSRGCKNVGWIKQGVKHMYVNHIITASPEGATGTVDMLMIGLNGDPYKIRHEGYYEDTYVRTPQGWRFKSRIHHVPMTTPPAEAGQKDR